MVIEGMRGRGRACKKGKLELLACFFDHQREKKRACARKAAVTAANDHRNTPVGSMQGSYAQGEGKEAARNL